MQTSDPLTPKVAISASGPHQVIGLYLELNDIKKNVKECSKLLKGSEFGAIKIFLYVPIYFGIQNSWKNHTDQQGKHLELLEN